MRRDMCVVEWLGWQPLLWWWLAQARWRGATVRYLDGHPAAIRWWQRRFPDGAVAQLTGGAAYYDWDGHLGLYERLERQAADLAADPVSRRLERFFPHPQTGRTLRRSLEVHSVTQWTTLHDLAAALERGAAIRWFPAREHRLLDGACPLVWATTPRVYRMALRFLQAVHGLVWPMLAALGRAARVVKTRGLARRLPSPTPWGVAQKVMEVLPQGRVPPQELLFGTGHLAPERILHLMEDAKPISDGTAAYFQQRKSAIIRTEGLPMPLGYWLRRVWGDFFFRLACPAFWHALWSRQSRELFWPAVRLGWQVVSCEIVMQHHRPRVYLAYDTYDVFCNVRTMVWEHAGVRCVGYLHGTPTAPLAIHHGLYVHTLLVAGSRIREMFGRTFDAVGQAVVVGQPHLDLAATAAPARRQPGHMVAAFDTSFHAPSGHDAAALEEFYLALLELLEAYPSLRLVLKRKYAAEVESNPGFDAVAAQFQRHPRVEVVSRERHTHELLAEASSVVAITISTTGIEALARGTPAFFFDPRPNMSSFYQQRYPFLVCRTRQELIARYGALLSGAYPRELMERVVEQESLRASEHPLTWYQRAVLAAGGLEGGETAAQRGGLPERPIEAGVQA